MLRIQILKMTKSKFIKYLLFGGISLALVTAGSILFLMWHTEKLEKEITQNELSIAKQLRDTFSCIFPDIISSSVDYTQIKFPINGLEGTYEPENLVALDPIQTSNPARQILISQNILEPLNALLKAGLESGHVLLVNSAYRSYQQQEGVFENPFNITETGLSLAARPGYSEHQLGTTVDVSAPLFSASQLQAGYRWMEANAHKFGFIHTYPQGSEEITGFTYEPWHMRYVSNEVAQKIYESGVIYNEQIDPFVEYAGALQPFNVDGAHTLSVLYSVEGKRVLLSPNQFSLTDKEIDAVIEDATDQDNPIRTFSLRAVDYTVIVEERMQLDAYHITIAKRGDGNKIHQFVKNGCKYLR